MNVPWPFSSFIGFIGMILLSPLVYGMPKLQVLSDLARVCEGHDVGGQLRPTSISMQPLVFDIDSSEALSSMNQCLVSILSNDPHSIVNVGIRLGFFFPLEKLRLALEQLPTTLKSRVRFEHFDIGYRSGGFNPLELNSLLHGTFANIKHLHMAGNHIGEVDSIMLAEILQNHQSIETLDLGHNDFTDRALAAWLPVIASQKKLRILDLSLSFRSEAASFIGARFLKHALKNLKDLEVLDLTGHQIGDQGLLELEDVLRQQQKLKKLVLRDTDITSNSGYILANILSHKRHLTHLDLSENHLGTQGALIVGGIVSQLPALNTLNLMNNHINNDGMTTIFEGMKKLKYLKELHIGANPIGDAGVESLSSALVSSSNLNTLDLFEIDMTKDGSRYLGDALPSLPSLGHLSVARNSLGTGVTPIAKGLAPLKQLKELDFQRTDMAIESAIELANVVEKASGLRRVVLGGNPALLTPKGASAYERLHNIRASRGPRYTPRRAML